MSAAMKLRAGGGGPRGSVAQRALTSMRQGPCRSTAGASAAAMITTRPVGVTSRRRPAGSAGDTVAFMPTAPVATVVVVPAANARVWSAAICHTRSEAEALGGGGAGTGAGSGAGVGAADGAGAGVGATGGSLIPGATGGVAAGLSATPTAPAPPPHPSNGGSAADASSRKRRRSVEQAMAARAIWKPAF